MNSSRQLGGSIGLAVLATLAAHHTGTATDPAALNDGYGLGLAVAAAVFVLAAVVAIGVLPRRRRPVAPVPQSTASEENELEGTPS